MRVLGELLLKGMEARVITPRLGNWKRLSAEQKPYRAEENCRRGRGRFARCFPDLSVQSEPALVSFDTAMVSLRLFWLATSPALAISKSLL